MSILKSLFAGEKRSSLENPSTSLLEWANNGNETHSGINVSKDSALRVSAVFACVRVIAETIGTLPLKVYERRTGGGRDEAPDHPLYDVLHTRPNEQMSSVTFFESVVGHVATWGNSFFEVERNNGGRVIGLWPLLPNETRVERKNGEKRLLWRDKPLPDRVEWIHVPGFGYDGVQGYSPIEYARQTIGYASALEEHGSRFFAKGARPSFFITTDKVLGDEAEGRIRHSVERAVSGMENAWRVGVLDESMGIETVGIPHDAAQWLESRKFTVEDIARFYRMQLHKISSLEKADFSNIEQQALEHITDTLRPYTVRFERVLNWELFPPAERGRFYAEFSLDGLLRGDSEARWKAYTAAWQLGTMSQDDIRDKENMNPLPDGKGKDYYVPLNFAPVGSTPAPAAPARAIKRGGFREIVAKVEVPPEGRELLERVELERRSLSRYSVTRAAIPIFRRAAEHWVNRETRALLREIRKAFRDGLELGELLKRIEAFYETFGGAIRREMVPVLEGYAETLTGHIRDETGRDPDPEVFTVPAMVEGYEESFENRYVSKSQAQLADIIADGANTSAEETQAALEARLEEWADTRAQKVANTEAVRAAGAFSKVIYAGVGVELVRWVNVGPDTCDLCAILGGVVVGVREFFLEPGDTVDPGPDSPTTPLRVKSPKGHPPLHTGCDCILVAETE